MSLVELGAFKAYVGVNRSVDLADDELLQAVLDAAGVGINEALDRHIAPADVVATPRSFPSRFRAELFIDDCVEVTSITDNASVLTVGQYQLEPLNNCGRSGEYRPYSEIRRAGFWYDSRGWAAVTVTARWGWAQIPAPITAACQILAKDILANRNVSFGIAAFSEYGIRARQNPQVWQLIQPYSLHVGVG